MRRFWCVSPRGCYPFFPVVRGWDEVSVTLERTASRLREGEFLNSEIVSKYVTDELANVVQLAHERAKVGGSDEVTPIDLRNTVILRPEGAPGRSCTCTATR